MKYVKKSFYNKYNCSTTIKIFTAGLKLFYIWSNQSTIIISTGLSQTSSDREWYIWSFVSLKIMSLRLGSKLPFPTYNINSPFLNRNSRWQWLKKICPFFIPNISKSKFIVSRNDNLLDFGFVTLFSTTWYKKIWSNSFFTKYLVSCGRPEVCIKFISQYCKLLHVTLFSITASSEIPMLTIKKAPTVLGSYFRCSCASQLFRVSFILSCLLHCFTVNSLSLGFLLIIRISVDSGCIP